MMADCRRWPSDLNCSLTIIGEEEEVVRAAAEHAASVHGHEDTAELRQQVREFLESADAYSNAPRSTEAMPG
jgi:predicted small metal-binding protein